VPIAKPARNMAIGHPGIPASGSGVRIPTNPSQINVLLTVWEQCTQRRQRAIATDPQSHLASQHAGQLGPPNPVPPTQRGGRLEPTGEPE
jgi:hypothetical protein